MNWETDKFKQKTRCKETFNQFPIGHIKGSAVKTVSKNLKGVVQALEDDRLALRVVHWLEKLAM